MSSGLAPRNNQGTDLAAKIQKITFGSLDSAVVSTKLTVARRYMWFWKTIGYGRSPYTRNPAFLWHKANFLLIQSGYFKGANNVHRRLLVNNSYACSSLCSLYWHWKRSASAIEQRAISICPIQERRLVSILAELDWIGTFQHSKRSWSVIYASPVSTRYSESAETLWPPLVYTTAMVPNRSRNQRPGCRAHANSCKYQYHGSINAFEWLLGRMREFR